MPRAPDVIDETEFGGRIDKLEQEVAKLQTQLTDLEARVSALAGVDPGLRRKSSTETEDGY